MLATSFESRIIDHGHTAGLGLPFSWQKDFLRRQPSSVVDARCPDQANGHNQAALRDQAVVRHEDILVRLPSLRESKWKVKVLQRWIGCVERVGDDVFLAVISDATNSHNPPELVELEFAEISSGDLPLIAAGATFYWSIGYWVTPGGQRERVSSLRFARQPRLSKPQMNRIFDQAERLASFLESD
jgi:hypothetical protein